MKRVYLLTGRPGTGKTSIIKQAVAGMKGEAGGFYTEEIRSRGVREGFRLVTLDGHSAILLEFKPRPGFKPSFKETEILSKLAGRAWFCEQDYQLMKAEVEFIDNMTFGWGFLARLRLLGPDGRWDCLHPRAVLAERDV